MLCKYQIYQPPCHNKVFRVYLLFSVLSTQLTLKGFYRHGFV